MGFLLRLSGEHPTLPKAELKAVLEGEGLEYKLREFGRLLVVETEADDSSFLPRLAYTLKAADYLGESGSLDELAGVVYDGISVAGSYRIDGPQEIQEKLGALLYKMGLRADLNNPDVEVWVEMLDEKYIAGLKVDLGRDYEKRKPQYRPYFHPTSMHPKLARAVVNLTRVRLGDTVLDPFCGTGGILIEAGLMGLNAVGWDVDARMVEGCRQNMREYDVEGEISVKNALDGEGTFDAIATDPPYGRASYATGDAGELVVDFIDGAREFLDEGSRMTIVVPEIISIKPDNFEIIDKFDVRIHRSLTRRIWVLEAI
jgi:tRNA (guanine10-N2)-dimethyltransferase